MIPGIIAIQRVVASTSVGIQATTSASTGATLSNSLVINAPAGVQDGDLLLLVVMHNDNARTLTASGFTQGLYSRTANNGLYIGRKTAASEPGSYTLQMDSTNTDRIVGVLVLLRFSYPPTLTTGTVARSTAGQTALSASSITLPSAGVLFAIAASELSSSMTISSALGTVNSVSAPYCNLAVFGDTGAQAGAYGAVGMTLSVATTGCPYVLVSVTS